MFGSLSVRVPRVWSRTLIALAIAAAPITIAAAPAVAEPVAPAVMSQGLPITLDGPTTTTPSSGVPSADPIWWRHGGWNGWGHRGWNGWGYRGWNGWDNQGWNNFGGGGGFGGGWGIGSGSAG